MDKITLRQTTDLVANHQASEEGQAIVDALDHATTLFRRIKENADQLAQYAQGLSRSDKFQLKLIQDYAAEALAEEKQP